MTHIELAMEEDKAYHIDYWAKLFKATTWEKIKVLAEKTNILEKQPILYIKLMQMNWRARNVGQEMTMRSFIELLTGK